MTCFFFITKEVSTASTWVYETLDQILSLLPAACRDYTTSLGSPTGLIVMAHQMWPCLCTFYQVLIFFFSKAMWGFKRPSPSKAGPLQSCLYIHANVWTHLFSNHLSVQLLPRWLNCKQKKKYSTTFDVVITVMHEDMHIVKSYDYFKQFACIDFKQKI